MYDIMWAFLIELDKVDASASVRKSAGAWAKLFAQAEGYIGTELLSSTETVRTRSPSPLTAGRPLRIFARFQKRFSAEYRTLDTQLKGLAPD